MKTFILLMVSCMICISSSRRRIMCKRRWAVCSTDGKTYQNECQAKRAKAAVQCDARCPCDKSCECAPIIHPVCGTDGKTYGNVCVAKKANATIACYSRCPCSRNRCKKICPADTEKEICGYNNYRRQCLRYCQLVFDIDIDKVIYKHYPGPCKKLDGAEGRSEDMKTFADGTTLITSGLYPGRTPRLLLFDFNDPTNKVSELPIEGNIQDFRPHGLSVWVEPGSDVHTVMIVNHGKQESVEFYEFTKSKKTINHKKSVLTGRIHLNNVIAVSNISFYGTEDAENFEGGIYLHMELLGLLRRGKVWYFDGNKREPVATGLSSGNGINISSDKKYLYVADFLDKKILTYKIKADNGLELVKKLYVNSLCDNIEVHPETGDLWIACHPRFADIYDYHFTYNGNIKAPSQVLRIKTQDGVPTSDITEVLLDDGSLISASAVASLYKGKLLIGSVASELVLCKINS